MSFDRNDRTFARSPSQPDQEIVVDDVARLGDRAEQIERRLLAEAAFEDDAEAILRAGLARLDERQRSAEKRVVLFARDASADGGQGVRFVGR